jgi:hypothetical protein
MASAAAAVGGRRDTGGLREGNEEGLGKWREEGDKRRGFGGNSEWYRGGKD